MLTVNSRQGAVVCVRIASLIGCDWWKMG